MWQSANAGEDEDSERECVEEGGRGSSSCRGEPWFKMAGAGEERSGRVTHNREVG